MIRRWLACLYVCQNGFSDKGLRLPSTIPVIRLNRALKELDWNRVMKWQSNFQTAMVCFFYFQGLQALIENTGEGLAV